MFSHNDNPQYLCREDGHKVIMLFLDNSESSVSTKLKLFYIFHCELIVTVLSGFQDLQSSLNTRGKSLGPISLFFIWLFLYVVVCI